VWFWGGVEAEARIVRVVRERRWDIIVVVCGRRFVAKQRC
jgi:hypothetical protein